jgi:spore coat protein CotF
MSTYSNFKISFKNQYLIYERTVKCTIKDYEMSYSYNPSLLNSGSNEQMLAFATGSSFMPYATAVGLYNDQNQLLAIAKFAQPLPISSETDTNVIIRMDI